MRRRIVQIAVAAPAGWNGLDGEEHAVLTEPDVFALDELGQAWRLVGSGASSRWVTLPELPDTSAKRGD